MNEYMNLVFLLIGIGLLGCANKTTELEPLDLLSQGLSIKINAPADAEVKVEDLGIAKDVTVQDSVSGYNLQIFESEASSLEAKTITNELKKKIEASTFFSEIISADEVGFIYKKVIDEDYINYDFRHVKVRGDRQYIFQAGLSRQYTLDEVQIMYNSVL